MPAIPTYEPSVIVIGDSVAWTKSIPDYPATVWTLTYSFQVLGYTGAPLPEPITFDADAAGANYSIDLEPADTDDWDAGDYKWTATVDDGTDRHTLSSGYVTLVSDPADPLADTHASRTLYLIELAIEGRIPAQLEQTTIDGQSILRIPLVQLMALRLQYQAEVRAERDRASAAAGQGSRRTMLARFRRPQ